MSSSSVRYHVEHFPQYRHPFVVMDYQSGKRIEGFNTRREAERRAKELNEKTRSNPAAHAIYARRGSGPLMHFDGRKFTNNGKPAPFGTEKRAIAKARQLIASYPVLKQYSVTVRAWSVKHIPPALRARRKNPEALDVAERKLEDFTGFEARKRAKVRMSVPRAAWVLGELDLIGYRTKRDGINGGKVTRYAHQFRKNSRPLLAASSDGKQLLIVGGRYETTEAGIEDR